MCIGYIGVFCGSLLDFTIMSKKKKMKSNCEAAFFKTFPIKILIFVFFFFQEELYDLILQTNKECIKQCKPGSTIRQLNTYSVI